MATVGVKGLNEVKFV